MPYTVAFADGGIKRHEFDNYVRLLGKRGIEWSDARRIAEPGTENRWLYVWEDRDQAESFRNEICKETGSEKWYVQELEESTPISKGPLMPVTIHVTRQSLGSTFTLHPHTRSAIRRRFPQSHQTSSLTIEFGRKSQFEEEHGPIWEHVAMVLTGLSCEQLSELDGYRIFDPATEETLYDSSCKPVG